jgi:hypothetical protein
MMEDQRFKTMRHIETVRNFLHTCILELLFREENHDQSKLQSPEREVFDEFTPKLRETEYGSEEYKIMMEKMRPTIDHHNKMNRHHPEHFNNGIKDMNLIDLIEMICDWKASSLRHNTGNIIKSIDIGQTRWGFSDELAQILRNTIKDLLSYDATYHKADES